MLFPKASLALSWEALRELGGEVKVLRAWDGCAQLLNKALNAPVKATKVKKYMRFRHLQMKRIILIHTTYLYSSEFAYTSAKSTLF